MLPGLMIASPCRKMRCIFLVTNVLVGLFTFTACTSAKSQADFTTPYVMMWQPDSVRYPPATREPMILTMPPTSSPTATASPTPTLLRDTPTPRPTATPKSILVTMTNGNCVTSDLLIDGQRVVSSVAPGETVTFTMVEGNHNLQVCTPGGTCGDPVSGTYRGPTWTWTIGRHSSCP